MKKSRKSSAQPASRPSSPRDHIAALVEWMSREVYEKEQIIAISLLSAVAGENVFLLGPPGTAKSMVASRLKQVFASARSFDYLMSRFSTPDEIFGPVSISRLKEHDRYERLTSGYLPEADVVFLDEIWKAGPSIQNTLLTVINEHLFYNGGSAMKVPMKILIAASNELPAPDEGLEALWDRFLMRMVSNCIESDSAFFRMIRSEQGQPEPLSPALLIDNELYNLWQRESRAVGCSDDVVAAIKALRRTFSRLEKQDNNRLRFYISDRRWRKAYRLMQTSAYLNGRSEINLSDFFLLIHAFWNDVETIPPVIDAFVSSLTEPLSHTLSMIERNIRLSMKPAEQPAGKSGAAPQAQAAPEFAEHDYFYYKVEGAPQGPVYFSKWDYATLGDTPRDGVRYFDTRRKRRMLHALIPGTTFEAASQNAAEVEKVRLSKCNGGVIIDGKPFSFELKNKAADTVAATGTSLESMPVYQRVEAMKTTFRSAVDRWKESVEAIWRKSPNIFLSRHDMTLVDKALKEADRLIMTTEVKLKNLDSML